MNSIERIEEIRIALETARRSMNDDFYAASTLDSGRVSIQITKKIVDELTAAGYVFNDDSDDFGYYVSCNKDGLTISCCESKK